MRRRLIASIAVLALAGSISGCTAASDASTSSASGGGTSSTTNAANVDTTLTADAVVAANSDPTTVNDDEWSAGDAADIFCAACYLAFEDSTVCNCGIQVDGAANTAGYVCGKGKIAHSAV